MLTSQIRRVLLALVLLNLVFVQITGAVSLVWMLPLFGVAIASPSLWNFQKFLLYRVAWNAALVAIFCLLIVDIKNSGIRYMLEDGLILAAFCQVHVLNNLIKQTRPDLVFFNSFLIALVTGFFCQDVVYSAVFVAYAVVLIIGLALSSSSSVRGIPTRVLPRAEFRGLTRRAFKQGLVALLFTGLVFTFWPRDFNREGLVDEQFVDNSAASEIAFADQIRFDRKNNTILSNRVVIKARVIRPGDVPSYWRGATFTTLHRYGWTADTNQQSRLNASRQIDEKWVPNGKGKYVRRGHQTGATMEVVLDDSRALNLFVPAETNRIDFSCAASPNIDGNFRLSRNDAGSISYYLEFNARDEPRKKVRGTPTPEHSSLRRRRVIPKGAHNLHAQLDLRIRSGATRSEIVESVRAFLMTEREYELPGAPGAADGLRGFIDGEGGGHCEYFATAMVILLRMRGVPCRMVSGYLAHEWNEENTELTIRSNDAHAWVEVWDEEFGWVVADPTPASAARGDDDDSFFAAVTGFFHKTWAMVTGFDNASREAALAWASERIASLWASVRSDPAWLLLALLGLFFLRRWRRHRRRGKIEPAVLEYLDLLKKLRLTLNPGETPRQLLSRAREENLPADAVEQLIAATEQHERLRYS